MWKNLLFLLPWLIIIDLNDHCHKRRSPVTFEHINKYFDEKTSSIMKAELDEWSPSFEQTSLKCRSTFASTMTLTSTTSKSLLTSMSRFYVDSHSRWPKYMFYRQDRLRRRSTLRIDASNVLRQQELSRCRHCFLAKEVPLFDSFVGGIWNIDKTDIETVSWLWLKSVYVILFLIKKSFNLWWIQNNFKKYRTNIKVLVKSLFRSACSSKKHLTWNGLIIT